MIKRVLLSLAIILSVTNTNAAVGDWTLHLSYHHATYCENVGDKIFVLSSGALFSYNKQDDEIRTYDKISTLSDNEISFIKYSKEEKALVIVYENANIDLLYDDESVYNISDFKNKTISNKKINNIQIIGNQLYLSTEFGIVILDLHKKEFNNTYNINKNVLCSYVFDNYLYAGTDEGLFRGKLTDNLLDNNSWTQLNNYRTNCLNEFSGELYCIIEPYGLYTLDTDRNRLTLIVKSNDTFLQYLYKSGNELLAGNKHKLVILDKDKNNKIYALDGKSNYILKHENTLWNCKGYSGIVKCSIEENSIVEISESILPCSPIRNYSEFMKFSNNELLVAGGNINYLDTKFYEGTLMRYNVSNDEWYNFPEEVIKEKTGLNYLNLCSIDENPNTPGHYYASSFGYGIYEFKDGEFVSHINNKNSIIESLYNNDNEEKQSRYIRITKVMFDNDGNLWCINTGTKDILKILKKDGTWESLHNSGIENMPTISDIMFDSRGWIWITSLQQDAGLFCIKPNGTLFDTSDDQTKGWFTDFKNQDGINYEIHQIYSVKEDRNGSIWVGTNTGLFVIENPKQFFENNEFTQIKIARNDGSGLADYLMNGVYIQSICIDGANRKWIGTKDKGIYLISEDGKETIHHFTTENSPLPSNGIASIAINENNGEVFIGTDKGIVSFISDATKPEETLNESNIHAFPNPVRADYSGEITVTGLTFDCNVKIVDAAGFLIYEGTSNGGSFCWDGKNRNGDRVASGVYYVLTYDENGNEGASTKILIIR